MPCVAERKRRVVRKGKVTIFGIAHEATTAPGVRCVNHDEVLAGLQDASSQRIDALDLRAGGVTDDATVDPGLVDLVHSAE